MTTSRGIKTLTHLKRPQDCAVLREDPRACTLPPPKALGWPTTPFPERAADSIAPPAFSLSRLSPSFYPRSSGLALSTGFSSQPPPRIPWFHLPPPTPGLIPLRRAEAAPASRDSFFFRANGDWTHPPLFSLSLRAPRGGNPRPPTPQGGSLRRSSVSAFSGLPTNCLPTLPMTSSSVYPATPFSVSSFRSFSHAPSPVAANGRL